MYGLLIQGLRNHIISSHSEAIWKSILQLGGCVIDEFDCHRVYDEPLLLGLYDAAAQVLNVPVDELKQETGRYFVDFLSRKGYRTMLSVLGRELRDFLNGLDNLHEFLRNEYPHMKPPSFFCVNEGRTGITLEYRSHRQGYVPFFMGWMEKLSEDIYNTKMTITRVGEQEGVKGQGTILRLHFDNIAFAAIKEDLLVPARVFFEAFPFNFIFDRGMKLISTGRSMAIALPNITGKRVPDVFHIKRPQIALEWNAIMLHTNNIFELFAIRWDETKVLSVDKGYTDTQVENPTRGCLLLRGQMKFMSEWDAIAFLGTPTMENVDAMWDIGLFLNDLSMHDSSRDMVLAGEQQAAELKLALEQESVKSKRLEESLQRLDEEMRRTDELLYQMIPKAVAQRLRKGEAAIDTCEAFENITLLLSDVVGFTAICSGLSPLEVVSLLNSLYSCFDALTEKHKVYKVETIGDAYMIASGCPGRTEYHAPLMAEMALEMIKSIEKVKDESTDPPQSLRIRVGLHTGPVVAGVVGVKMPRYCLFGSTVTTTELMESTSEPQRIQMGRATYEKLEVYKLYNMSEKGTVRLGNGETIRTYWLNGRPSELSCAQTAKFCDKLQKERERLADANIAPAQQVGGEGWESRTASQCSSARNSASKRSSIMTTRRGSISKQHMND